MSLATIMLEQLAVARRIVEDGEDVVPTWRIGTTEGAFIVLAPFDEDQPEQRERVLHLISRFMAWKLATSFVMTAETWLGDEETRIGEEALLVIGVSHQERLAALQRIVRGETVAFSDPLWLAAHHVDEQYFAMLPTGRTEITAEEAMELVRIFGEDGEMEAKRLS
jgi:hypothetical protein